MKSERKLSSRASLRIVDPRPGWWMAWREDVAKDLKVRADAARLEAQPYWIAGVIGVPKAYVKTAPTSVGPRFLRLL